MLSIPKFVALTDPERQKILRIARARDTMNVDLNLAEKYGHSASPQERFMKHYSGATGEGAVAKLYGFFAEWDGALGQFGRARDVGNLEVRTRDGHTTPTGRVSLILHPTDNDESPFVCAQARSRQKVFDVVEIYGWLFAREGKLKRWWSDPTGQNRWAFFVSLSALHSMQDLQRIARTR